MKKETFEEAVTRGYAEAGSIKKTERKAELKKEACQLARQIRKTKRNTDKYHQLVNRLIMVNSARGSI
jgi:hypothetical protein